MITAIKTLGEFVLCAWLVMVMSNLYYNAIIRNKDVDARIKHWMETHGLIVLYFAVQNHLMRIVIVYMRTRIMVRGMMCRCMELITGGDDDV